MWLIQKYRDQLWNKRKYENMNIGGNVSTLEDQLMAGPLIPLSGINNRLGNIPDEPGVYMIFMVQAVSGVEEGAL